MIENLILKGIVSQNINIAQNFTKNVWESHPDAIAKLSQHNYRDLLQDQDFLNFSKDVIKFFDNKKSNIRLYDGKGNKFISSGDFEVRVNTSNDNLSLYGILLSKLDKYFLKAYMDTDGLNNAYMGRSSHKLMPDSFIVRNNGEESKASFITSYIPVIDSNLNDSIVDGVLEITTDITGQWRDISYLEKRVFLSFFIIFSIFFGVVMYNTHYAQKIINKQFETNRDLEEAKNKAETENTAKTEFLANVSHELRTPLNAIIGFSEIMMSETYGKIENAQYRDYVNDINNSGKHLLSVINDILDFSKASADKLKVDHVELDLNKLASSSMRFVKPRADEAKVQLLEDLPKEHIIIMADPKRLKQALLNLLSNSVKFTPENGSVTMVIRKDEGQKKVQIQVVDTGIGMSDKDIPKALASFGQVDNKLSRKYEGTGLGLPLTKKLVELMQGEFDLQSELGKGTTVTLTFKYEGAIEI
jgi:two-component system cell cycle sensor histidine kinase PleC